MIKVSTMRALAITLLSIDAAAAFVHPYSALPQQLDTLIRLEAHEHDRRELLASCAATLIGSSIFPNCASASMTDETLSFAMPSLDPSYTQQSPKGSVSSASVSSAALPTDEITFTITKSELQNTMKNGGFGLELGEVEFKTNFRVTKR